MSVRQSILRRSALAGACLALAVVIQLALQGCRAPGQASDETPVGRPQPIPVELGAVDLGAVDLGTAIVDREWVCVEIDGAAVADGVMRPTLRFGRDGRVSGKSPVNQYGAAYRLDGADGIELGPVMSTLMAGRDEDMKVESSFMRALQAASNIGYRDGKLGLSAQSGVRVLLFEPMPALCGDGDGGPLPVVMPAPLAEFAGSEWVCVAIEGEAVPSDGGVVMTVAAEGALQGRGGVNRFAAAAKRAEDGIRIGPIVATEMAGSPEAGARERRFFAALERARQAARDGADLSLRDAAGREILRFRPR
jgi:heat shock protein HslJ